MTSLPGMFDSSTAQVIAAIGVLIFLALWGAARLLRGYAEVLKAKATVTIPPPKPPPKAIRSPKSKNHHRRNKDGS